MKNRNKNKSVAFMFLFSVFVVEQEVSVGIRLPWIHCLHILDCSIYGMGVGEWVGGGGHSEIKVILKRCG